MSRNRARPLSPHLTIWRWGPHMLVSILHRATGTAMAVGGGLLFVWWLLAAAGGAESYATFYYYAVQADDMAAVGWIANIIARVVAIGLTWSFFQHMASGIRHLVMDSGAGYELKTNRFWARMTMVASALLTVLAWGYLFAIGRGAI